MCNTHNASLLESWSSGFCGKSSAVSTVFRWLRSTDDSEAVETQEYWNVDPLHEMVSISGPSE
jgi:hypothetical protein